MFSCRTSWPFCRTYNPSKALHPPNNQITRTLAGISAAGLLIASAGLGAIFAWSSGSQHGALMASLMVMMAVALELAKPLAVASALSSFRCWAIVRGTLLSLLAVVAIGYSLCGCGWSHQRAGIAWPSGKPQSNSMAIGANV